MGLSGSDKAYMQARAGLARADGTRSGYFYPNVLVLINGTDRARYVDVDAIEVQDLVADQPNRCTFQIRGPLTIEPSVGQSVIVALGANQPELREFSGTIMSVKKTTARAGNRKAIWTVDCSDDQWLLDRRFVNASFSEESASLAALEILTDFTSGFSVGYIESNLPAITTVFTNVRPTTAWARIASMVGATFYWDEDDKIYLYITAPAGQTPASLTDSNTRFRDLSIDVDLKQIRTRVIVEGKRTSCPVSTPSGEETIVVDASSPLDYLVVAGGGAGNTTLGGGGGGGGVLSGTYTIGSGTYTITIGAGGVASNGSDSAFGGFVATGGGRGGTGAGSAGGSGGGGSNGSAGGAGTSGQGNTGGAGDFTLSAAGGGGGGGGAVGGNAGPNAGGSGGVGFLSSISGSPAYYAGGGGGNGASTSGAGGLGGGGNGGAGGSPGTAGTANTGGGGGGGGSYNGGSGIVILSYPTGALSASGGTITAAGGRTIHTFTSNDSFVVSTITYTSAPAEVTDLPVNDHTQLEATGGRVRIGTHVLDYESTIGPDIVSGENLPGSTLATDAAIFATSIEVVDISVFADAYGWVKVGDQIVRYGSKSGSNLQDIPATGFGALQTAVKADTQVTWLGGIRIDSVGMVFDPAIVKDEEVVQRVEVDDTAAQTTLAALEGGDGIHEHLIQDGRLSVQGAQDRAQAELENFSLPLQALSYETRDIATRSGRIVTANLTGLMALSGSYTVQQVDVSFSDMASRTVGDPRAFPKRTVHAAPLRKRTIIDMLGASEDSIP